MHPGIIAIIKMNCNIHTKTLYIFQKDEKDESRLIIGKRLPESKFNRTFKEFTFWKFILMSSIGIVWLSVLCIHFASRLSRNVILYMFFFFSRKHVYLFCHLQRLTMPLFGNNSIIPLNFYLITGFVYTCCHMTCNSILYFSLQFIMFYLVISVHQNFNIINNIAYFWINNNMK